MYPVKMKQIKAGWGILILVKLAIWTRKLTKDKEGHFIIIKGSVHQDA